MSDEQYIQDEAASGRKFFTTLLNIADEDLNPYQYRLYGHYVRVAGEAGACYESVRTTAQITRMSPAMVIKTRGELTDMRYIQCVKSDEQNDTIAITVVDRWAENIRRCSEKRSPHKHGVHHINTPLPEGVHSINTGVHQESQKKNYKKKNTKEEEGTTTTTGGGGLPAAPVVVQSTRPLPNPPAAPEFPALKPDDGKEEKGSAQKEESVTAQTGADDGLAQVARAYEANIGLLTPLLRDALKDALDDYPAAWILEAIDIAVKSEKRFWNYAYGVLKKWKRNGKDTPAKPASPIPGTSAGKQQQYVTFETSPFSAPTTANDATKG